MFYLTILSAVDTTKFSYREEERTKRYDDEALVPTELEERITM
jgi:hypothetical protein